MMRVQRPLASVRWIPSGLLGLAVLASGMARGQEAPIGDPEANPEVAKLLEAYARKAEALKTERLQALADLAGKADPQAATAAYEVLFQLTIQDGLYAPAEAVADRLLANRQTLAPRVRFFAEIVNLVAEVDRGAGRESIESIRAALAASRQDAAAKGQPDLGIPVQDRIAFLEIYLQRLQQRGQYDVAREALELITGESRTAEVQDYLKQRLARLALVGQPAPAIAGTDLDGKPLRLDAYVGKDVLIVFWASWCVPCAEKAPELVRLYDRFHAQGFEVIGVNLDVLQDGGVSAESVMPNVRRFILDYNLPWPNLMNGAGGQDVAKAYGISDLPSNVWVGRDGKVKALDVTLPDLDRQLEAATRK